MTPESPGLNPYPRSIRYAIMECEFSGQLYNIPPIGTVGSALPPWLELQPRIARIGDSSPRVDARRCGLCPNTLPGEWVWTLPGEWDVGDFHPTSSPRLLEDTLSLYMYVETLYIP